jgi:predicted RNase H-like nuclease (RuvC/YqgF family)
MKYLLFIFLFGCSLKAQNKIEDPKEKEYRALMSKFNSTLEVSAEVQDKASSKQAELVDQAAETITSLKNEVSNLKTELNEVKAKLDSVNADSGRSFVLLPISNK